MSKRAGNTMFQHPSQSSENEKTGSSYFEQFDIFDFFHRLNHYFNQIKEFDGSEITAYWHTFVFYMKIIVFLAVFYFFWSRVLKPYFRRKRLENISKQI